MISPAKWTQPQLRALMSRLNPVRVKKRKQGGQELSYLEAWDVRATLIRIFGFGNFSVDLVESEIVHHSEVQAEYNSTLKYRDVADPTTSEVVKTPVTHHIVAAKAVVRLAIHSTGATYTEAAIASQKGPDFGEVADFAIKTAESDALKRAAINLGTQFGLGLYDGGSTAEVVSVLLDPEQAEILKQEASAEAKPEEGKADEG